MNQDGYYSAVRSLHLRAFGGWARRNVRWKQGPNLKVLDEKQLFRPTFGNFSMLTWPFTLQLLSASMAEFLHANLTFYPSILGANMTQFLSASTPFLPPPTSELMKILPFNNYMVIRISISLQLQLVLEE